MSIVSDEKLDKFLIYVKDCLSKVHCCIFPARDLNHHDKYKKKIQKFHEQFPRTVQYWDIRDYTYVYNIFV